MSLVKEGTKWEQVANYTCTCHSCLVSPGDVLSLLLYLLYRTLLSWLFNNCFLFLVGGDASLNSQLFPLQNISLREGDASSSSINVNDSLDLEASFVNRGIGGFKMCFSFSRIITMFPLHGLISCLLHFFFTSFLVVTCYFFSPINEREILMPEHDWLMPEQFCH